MKNQNNHEQYEELASEIRDITKQLRKQYYINSHKQNYCDTTPFGGSIRESIGPFPEFILKGRFCKRSINGLCTPCFYSRLPEHNISEASFDKGYLSQVDYIVNNFDELVVKNQIGKIAGHLSSSKPTYAMVCTPTGSYFDNKEYPIYVRKSNLKKLLEISKIKNCNIVLHIETHVEDVLEYFKKPDKQEISLLKELNTRIIFGFESSNDFSRNIIYGKNLLKCDFEKSINIVSEYGFSTGAFVFAGLFAYNDAETINDVKNTLQYLKQLQVSPVIMFANTQKYTIPDLLLTHNKYKLLDAHTVLEITKMVVDIFGCDMSGNIDPWFIADPVGGPPEPNMHIFNSPQNTACSDCSKKIYTAIEELRITKNKKEFYKNYEELHVCSCNNDYLNLIQKNSVQSNQTNIAQRIVSYIDIVKQQFPFYVLSDNPWLVKAELLCYGLSIPTKFIKMAKSYNPFIEEKGLIHAVHIIYKGSTINVCVAEKFCSNSPYSVEFDFNKKSWILLKNSIYLGEFEFLVMPNWTNLLVDDIKIGNILRPHNEKCLSLWPSTECTYIREGKGCLFCGLNNTNELNGKVISQEIVVSAIKKAFEANPNYEINLSGGTCHSPESAIQYLAGLCNKIKEIKNNTVISVECAPPKNNDSLYKLYVSGATAVIMNIEIFNDKLRKVICPGKSHITIDRYLSALEYASQLFGKGNVSSVLIMGLQPKEDIIFACEELIKRGVIPTIMPFKPLDGTKMSEHKVPEPTEYIEISRHVAYLLNKYQLQINPCSGCASCGGCSLETDLT
ncbi:MAG: radical SAM protein [Acutalibacteraceae bacterium]|nr:radical SAM protein [Acutalibacteraceae bacterium]